MFGYPPAEIREMTFEEFSANTSSYTQPVAERRIAAAVRGVDQNFDWRIKRANGELIWVNIHLSRLIIDEATYVVGEVTNITEYKHNDRQVRLFHRLLRHNLRNDINVISGFAQHIGLVSERDAVETAAEKIENAATSLSRMSESVKQIEDTITETRCDWTRQPARAVVTEIVDTFRTTHSTGSITITEQTEMWVAVDEAFQYALTHAIENATVHSNHPEPTVRIGIDESPNTGRVEIRIVDEGPLIPAMEIDALDESTETTPISHGSGVGLFVMKWCIESLGGELTIEQNSLGGNTVFFYLPPKTPPETGV
jgi:PAS domain S-box-containing protein